MRAMQITRQGGPEELQLVELPDPKPGAGEILVEVRSASVNFSDTLRRSGADYPDPTPLPFVPGGEVAGTVAALGDGVEGPAVGTPVLAVVGDDVSGGYAELALARASAVIPIPEGLNFDQAAGIVITGLTATLMLGSVGALAAGESVLVPAAGGALGSYAVQIAKELGAGTIFAAASSAAKRQVALDLGATHAVDYTQPGWEQSVREHTDGAGVDIALEMTGGDRLPQTLLTLAPFGRLIVYGMASGVPGRLDADALFPVFYGPGPNQSLYGFNLGGWFVSRPEVTFGALSRLIGWVASGAIKTPATTTLPLEQAGEAHRLIESGATSGKLILKP